MLKLVFYTHELSLKVRLATGQDDFGDAFNWKNQLQFILSDCGDFTMIWTSLLPDLDSRYAEALVDLVSARYPISNEYKKLQEECPKLTYINNSQEWVIFGGTFNPWHQGHQACLNLLPEDKTCLIMPDLNPHKEPSEAHPVSTILEISNKAKFKKHHFLVPTFLVEGKKNPTVQWVEKMKQNHPEQKISLLMGFDSFAAINTWTRSEDLLNNLFTIYVASRLENQRERELALVKATSSNPKLNVIFLGKHEFEKLSSTEARKKY